MLFKFCSGGCPESKLATWARAEIGEMFFSVKAIGRKDSNETPCVSYSSAPQLPVALFPPSFPVLELLFVSISDPLQPCPSLRCSFLSNVPLFAKFPRHLIAHLYPALHYLLPLPIPWCLWFLPLHPSVYIVLHGQTGILASGPPLTAPLWDLTFSPGRGSYYHEHAKRLTTCHEKIVECQGHKN